MTQQKLSQQEPRPLRRVVIKEEFVALTGSVEKAQLLGQLEYWQQRTYSTDEYIREEQERASKEGRIADIPLTNGWFYKTAAQLKEESFFGKSRQVVRRHLSEMVESGWLRQRNSPHYQWDRTLQYRLDLVKIAADLAELGYELSGWKAHGYPLSIADNQSSAVDNQSSAVDNQSSAVDVQYQRLSTEITPEITKTEITPEISKTEITKDVLIQEQDARATLPQAVESAEPTDKGKKSAIQKAPTGTKAELYQAVKEVYNASRPPNWAECRAIAGDRRALIDKALRDHGEGLLQMIVDAMEGAGKDRRFWGVTPLEFDTLFRKSNLVKLSEKNGARLQASVRPANFSSAEWLSKRVLPAD